MKVTQTNWFHNPTKPALVFMTGLWIVGIIFIAIDSTNGFSEKLYLPENPFYYFFGLLGSASILVSMYVVYFRHKRNK